MFHDQIQSASRQNQIGASGRIAPLNLGCAAARDNVQTRGSRGLQHVSQFAGRSWLDHRPRGDAIDGILRRSRSRVFFADDSAEVSLDVRNRGCRRWSN
jgi:hypothetical protein